MTLKMAITSSMMKECHHDGKALRKEKENRKDKKQNVPPRGS